MWVEAQSCHFLKGQILAQISKDQQNMVFQCIMKVYNYESL